jgi:hypothetical protein
MNYETGERDDIYQLSVGNLAPGNECLLTIKYVMELETEGEAIKLTLPITRTALLPTSDKEKEESNPLKWEGINLAVHLRMSSPISEILSKNHPIHTQIDEKRVI